MPSMFNLKSKPGRFSLLVRRPVYSRLHCISQATDILPPVSMGGFKKFRLLLWKNFVLQKRHAKGLAFQLIVPVILAIILVITRQRAKTIYYNHSLKYEQFTLADCKLSRLPQTDTGYPIKGNSSWLRISYAPANEIVNQIMVTFGELYLQRVEIQAFSSEDNLVDFFKSNETTTSDVGAVVFMNVNSRNDLSGDLTYKLRFPLKPQSSMVAKPDSWLTQFTYPTYQEPGPRASEDSFGGAPGYCQKGFLSVQHGVARAITNVLTAGDAESEGVNVIMQRFPFPSYYTDYMLTALKNFLPLIIMLSLLYPAFDLIKSLVLEKEKRLKEFMKMMGLSSALHWSSWFTKSLILFGIDGILIAFLMCCTFGKVGVLAKSDGSLFFVYLLLYIISVICFCFMISTFFSKANSGATAGGLIFFFSFVPYFYLVNVYATMSIGQKIAASLLCNVAMAFGGMQIYTNEGAGFGVQWNRVATPITPDDNFTMAAVMAMLAFDSILYLIITWYVDAVFPGEYGMPQKWYFMFQKRYWFPNAKEKLSFSLPPARQKADLFEEEPIGLSAGIQIQSLTKVFGKKKVAVNNLSMNMFCDQITVLLGHNGAGKTTTMSMLTGLFPPSQGSAYINGYSVVHELEKTRSSLGLCPQHNIVFDDLTVAEHFYFSCQLKECEASRVQKEIDEMLIATDLEAKRNSLSAALSGGMKRRLCVGMALVGGSKVVLLDEPTSGMDPTARRFTWDLLQAQSKGRAILLSTHFMDEADILGDRIAIMAHGELQCCGTPMFLKRKFGAGYHMIIVKKPGCDVDKIKALITSTIPKAEMESNIGAELSFILPHSSNSKFPKLFTQIEQQKEQLRISSYGASITTMEEVFLRVGERADSSLKAILNSGNGAYDGKFEKLQENGASLKNGLAPPSKNGSMPPANAVSSSVQILLADNQENRRNTGCSLFMQQLRGMIIKRILHTKRNWALILGQLVAPIIIVAICFAILKAEPKDISEPALPLTLNPFGFTSVLYSSQGDEAAVLASDFADQFTGTKNTPLKINAPGPTADLTQYLLEVANNDSFKYSRHYIVAGSFFQEETNEKLRANIMFNNQPFHSPAVGLAALDNTLIRYFTGNKNFSLTVINDPLPSNMRAQVKMKKLKETKKLNQKETPKANEGTKQSMHSALGISGKKFTDVLMSFMTSFLISFDILIAISFLTSSFVIFLVKERASDAKHLQFVSGVQPFTFWMSTFLWDFINFILPCMCIMFLFFAFQINVFKTGQVQAIMFLVFVLYGWCSLPFMYLFSFMFDQAASAYARVTMFNIFSGVVALITITMLTLISDQLRKVAKILDWIFMILPNYCLGASIKDLYLNGYNMKICETYPEYDGTLCNCGNIYCLNYSPNYLAWNPPGIGRELAFMSLWGVLYFTILLILELGLGNRLMSAIFSLRWSSRKPESVGIVNPLVSSADVEDSDVKAERQRIMATPITTLSQTDNLVLKDLCKYYGIFKPFRAVNNLTAGVPRGECFGLLGINGAGKTTTFKMLTGDETVSGGDAYVEGFSIRKEIKKVQRRLGYCPQFDAIIDEMTGRETLYMFSRLRGILEKDIANLIVNLSKNLLFTEHLDKLVKNYSGGNKRKLSTAVALIGNPPIVFLDEPTTGMDPLARRLVWDTITRVRDSGSSIVLTSHSMEECDILCTRLAIMVNGCFKCLGSPQHLKNKFGNGYTLTAKIQNNSLTANRMGEMTKEFQAFVKQAFPGSILKDQHFGMVHYHIPNSSKSWGEMFSILEKARLQFHLEDYALGQTSLEQVFLGFTLKQQSGSIST